jgi:hypothetical protein
LCAWNSQNLANGDRDTHSVQVQVLIQAMINQTLYSEIIKVLIVWIFYIIQWQYGNRIVALNENGTIRNDGFYNLNWI